MVRQQVESQIKVRDFSSAKVSIAPAEYTSWSNARTELMAEAKASLKARLEAELAAADSDVNIEGLRTKFSQQVMSHGRVCASSHCLSVVHLAHRSAIWSTRSTTTRTPSRWPSTQVYALELGCLDLLFVLLQDSDVIASAPRVVYASQVSYNVSAHLIKPRFCSDLCCRRLVSQLGVVCVLRSSSPSRRRKCVYSDRVIQQRKLNGMGGRFRITVKITVYNVKITFECPSVLV